MSLVEAYLKRNVFSGYPPWSRRRRTQETGVVMEKELHHTLVLRTFSSWSGVSISKLTSNPVLKESLDVVVGL